MPEKGKLTKAHIINAVIEQNSLTQKKSFETVDTQFICNRLKTIDHNFFNIRDKGHPRTNELDGQRTCPREYSDDLIARLGLLWGDGFLSPGGATEVAIVLEGLDSDRISFQRVQPGPFPLSGSDVRHRIQQGLDDPYPG